MQQINNVAALVQAQASLAQPITQERKQDSFLSESTIKLTALVFTRFADLFGAKVNSRGMVIYADSEKGIFSEAFKLWCRKLSDLTDKDFKNGIEGVERKQEAMYRDGEDMWPPSYAEFKALCFPNVGRDTQAHKYFPPPIGVEDLTAKEKRREIGIKNTSAILEDLGAVKKYEPPKVEENYFSSRLEAAKKLLEQKNATT
jgi:hypothetical protein